MTVMLGLLRSQPPDPYPAEEHSMFINGIVIGVIAFLVIGFFHPVVIYGEYHFGTRLWPVFIVLGILFCAVSLFVKHQVLNAALGITAFSCFWSILELFKQRKRVERGWFPKKQKREPHPEYQKIQAKYTFKQKETI
jgi:hypothetical protein